MTQFERPVRSTDLLSSPEMQLTYRGETEGRVGSAVDEGVGNGFDNGSPRAYAERWFTTTDDATAVHRWFQDELSSLGWSEVSATPT